MNVKNNGTGYVIPADIDPSRLPTAGAIAWWRLSGTVDHEKLTQAWVAAGLSPDALPMPPTPEQGIRRALREQEERRVLARPLKDKGSYALVEERLTSAHGTDAELSYQVAFKVTVNSASGDITFDPDGGDGQIRQDEIRAAFAKHMAALSPGDISNWLVDLAYKVKSVSLRDTGGIYFIPSTMLTHWHKAVEVIRAVSAHSMFEVPALKSDEAVDAILDAISMEAKDEIAKLENALDSDMGARGLRSRSEKAKEMLAKLKSYEALLGKGAANIGQRLEELSVELSTAALAAEEA